MCDRVEIGIVPLHKANAIRSPSLPRAKERLFTLACSRHEPFVCPNPTQREQTTYIAQSRKVTPARCVQLAASPGHMALSGGDTGIQ